MISDWHSFFGLIGLVLVGCAERAPKQAAVEHPTLCQLTQAREAYAGRVLTVEGYFAVSMHGNSIVDPSCRGAGIDIRWQSDQPQLQAFISFVRRIGEFEPWVARVRATGVVVRNESGGEYAPSLSLRLNAADVLDAWKVPEAEQERFGMWIQGAGPPPVRPSH